jgi:cytochrome c-type biogenesis protein CcmH/NrfG
MKLFAACVVAFLLVLPVARAQENPDDQYVIVYTLIQQGDTDLNAGQTQPALEQYREAQQELLKFQQVYGDWNPTIVNFRLKYLSDKIAALAPPSSPATNPPPAAAAQSPAPSSAELQAQIGSLNSQIRQLESDDATLQAKLKEALSVQPATVSPDAFTQMQEQLKQLARENDLLKATAASNSVPQNNPQVQKALAEQTARATRLAQENQSLQARVQSLTTSTQDAEALREENALLKKEMANMNSTGGNGSNDAAMAQENLALRARVQALTTDANAAEALREENAVLKRQLANANPGNAAPAPAGGNVAIAQEQVAQFQAEETADWLERKGLENRIRLWQAESVNSDTAATTPDTANLQSQIHELTQERDNLLSELGDAHKKLYGHNNQTAAQQNDLLAQQVETLRARVAVDEAATVPYTPQELALFKSEPPTPNPDAEKKSIHELPRGAKVLVAEAQSYYTKGQYSEAAADYEKILKSDANNPLALANLAAIELEEDKLADADQHIEAAVAQSPDDAYNLTILGRIKFSEAKYDDALDALDQAAKLDSQSAEIQNFLGVALAEKGLRSQAETAFRKSIPIQPDYADAHKNLAIVYLSAHPPEIELARWHYEKALAAGMPPNPEFEKMLNSSGGGTARPRHCASSVQANDGSRDIPS